MKKLILLFLLIPTICQASPPARIYSYTTGTKIEADKVTANEDSIFNYLSTGIDTIRDGIITTDDISASAAIPYSKLSFSNDITATDIATGGLTTTEILDATITADDIATGAVASAEILNDTIINEDINSSAGIVDTKLATISTAGKVLGSALNTLSGVPSGAGQIPVANLGTGTGSSSNYLRGDGAWTVLTDNTSNVVFSFSGFSDNSGLGNVGLYVGDTINPTADNDPTLSFWMIQQTGADQYKTLINTRWTKIAGVSTITVYANTWTNGAVYGGTCRVNVGTAVGTSAVFTTTTPAWVNFTVDVSSLVDGTNYDVTIQLEEDHNSTDGVYLSSIIAFGS